MSSNQILNSGIDVYLLSAIYYLSITAIVIFALLTYLLRLNVWPTPDKPRRSLFFSIFGNVWLAVNLFLAVYLSLIKPESLFFTNVMWKVVAVLLLLIGVLVSLWAWILFKTLKRVFGMEMNVLITVGPYKYVRHPQYFSVMLVTIALAMFLNTLQLLLFAVATTVSFYIVALMEERKLEELFGQEYREYRERTPMFIPLLKIRWRRK